jgi:hypothetical protein
MRENTSRIILISVSKDSRARLSAAAGVLCLGPGIANVKAVTQPPRSPLPPAPDGIEGRGRPAAGIRE